MIEATEITTGCGTSQLASAAVSFLISLPNGGARNVVPITINKIAACSGAQQLGPAAQAWEISPLRHGHHPKAHLSDWWVL